MTLFTSRSFRRRVSIKSKKSRRRQTRRRSQRGGGDSSARGQAHSTPTVGGGDTFSREIPKNAVVTNPIQIT